MSDEPKSIVGTVLDSADIPDVADMAGPDADVVNFEEVRSENKSKEIALRFKNAYLKQLKDEHNLRKKFVPYVYWLVVGLLLATFALLTANGVCRACGRLFLSDKVLLALMGSTLADIVGILYIAVRWLFVSSVRR